MQNTGGEGVLNKKKLTSEGKESAEKTSSCFCHLQSLR